MSVKASAVVWDIFLGRVVPIVVFGSTVVAKAISATGAQAAAGESVAGTLYFANELAGLFLVVLLFVAYVTRAPRRAGRRDPIVLVVVALVIAAPVTVAFPHRPHAALDAVGLVIATFGLAYALFALLYLRRSFSVLPEARELVTGGPYAVTRHPLYLAETIAMLGVLLPMADWRILFFVPFVVGQVVRARWEEAVLAAQFPDEYAAYAARVPRYVPFLR